MSSNLPDNWSELTQRSDVGIYDRVVIQDILKEIAQTQQVDLNAKQRFKGLSILPLADDQRGVRADIPWLSGHYQ